jgi:hypothetical protein
MLIFRQLGGFTNPLDKNHLARAQVVRLGIKFRQTM